MAGKAVPFANSVKRRCMTRFGGHCGVDHRKVRRWEQGECVPDIRHQEVICELFELPWEERDRLGFPTLYQSEGESTSSSDSQSAPVCSRNLSIRADGLPWLWDEARIAQAISELARTELVLNRREAVKGTTVVMGAALIEPLHRWLDRLPAVDRPRADGPIGEDEVDLIEATARVFRAWGQYGGGLGRKAVIGQLSEVTELLRERHPAPIARRLFAVTAELAETAGSMSWDAGLHTSAQQHYVLAVQAAKAGEDQPFAASVLAAMARQMLDLEHQNDALDLIHLAQYGSRKTASARLRAMLYTREA